MNSFGYKDFSSNDDFFSMKFCLLVTVALDIFIKEKNNTSIFPAFPLCHFFIWDLRVSINAALSGSYKS